MFWLKQFQNQVFISTCNSWWPCLLQIWAKTKSNVHFLIQDINFIYKNSKFLRSSHFHFTFTTSINSWLFKRNLFFLQEQSYNDFPVNYSNHSLNAFSWALSQHHSKAGVLFKSLPQKLCVIICNKFLVLSKKLSILNPQIPRAL